MMLGMGNYLEMTFFTQTQQVTITRCCNPRSLSGHSIWEVFLDLSTGLFSHVDQWRSQNPSSWSSKQVSCSSCIGDTPLPTSYSTLASQDTVLHSTTRHSTTQPRGLILASHSLGDYSSTQASTCICQVSTIPLQSPLDLWLPLRAWVQDKQPGFLSMEVMR